MTSQIDYLDIINNQTHYPALIALLNHVKPDAPTNIEETRYWDNILKTSGRQPYRILAYAGHLPMGSGWAYIEATPAHATRFQIQIDLRSDFMGQGIIEELHSRLLKQIMPHEPTQLASVTFEDNLSHIKFLKSNGYELAIESWRQVLEVESVDISDYDALLKKVADNNITIHTHASLAHDPNRDTKLYELMVAVEHDIPVEGMAQPLTYDEWLQDNGIQSPYFLSDGLFIAVHDDEYVGVCQLFKPAKARSLHNGITGVHKDYRRKGIALALKISAIRYAQQQGIVTITTYNESNNQPVLKMNEQLGFRKSRAELTFTKTL